MTIASSPTELLAKELHYVHLKPIGFKKHGKMFTRRLPEYTEVVQLEASSHNVAPGPWRFGITIGARFDDIEPPYGSQAARGQSHAVGALRSLVPNLPPWFEVDLPSIPTQAGSLAALISAGLSRIPEFVEAARANVAQGRMTLIPLQKWDPQYTEHASPTQSPALE